MKKIILIIATISIFTGCSIMNLLKKNHPPIFSNDYFPSNKSEKNCYQNLEIKWECGDPENRQLYFDLYFGDNPEELKIISKKMTKQNYSVFFDLYPETDYYYKIIAIDKRNIVESPLIQFSTNFYNPEWWEKQDKKNIYYYGVALHEIQRFSHTLASENAKKYKYSFLKPQITKQMDELLYEAHVIDTLALKMAQQVMELMANDDYSKAEMDIQETMVTKLEYYRTYTRYGIPRRTWNTKLYRLIKSALPLYNEIKFSQKFRKFEAKYKN
ncbi:MAG: hypothetical protein K8S23_12850 [Candidatus Cloacimonetes bacterium]|nr:hypothetical protein [Candidatus Cloacimonadota bacterium]